ncbi:hypothetical protein BUALT_Bualt03G0013500 [Buddleja alternifolia]|uniref:FAS1 domain-containing protein n=1 Tax=Buddleja alternifolia TaxID=168488 RepID=A0AAV6XQA6_9LAMI|nr:hypothetical protein BUALT_Bualt03G0013500 [Buddleja alternifolia]
MAVSFSLRLLLLVAALTTTTTTVSLISAEETPAPSSHSPPPEPPSFLAPPPKPPSFLAPPSKPPSFLAPPPTPFSTAQTPPPPPAHGEEENQQNQLNNIVDALIGAGDFAGWANLLSSADPSSLPLTATFFIPSNDAISNLPSATTTEVKFDPYLIPYHIVPQRLTFSDLQQFAIHTSLPTLLPSKYIVITNNSSSNFTINNDSEITHPDIFVNGAFTVHGITNVLGYSVRRSPPPENTKSPRPISTPNQRKPIFPERTFGVRSGASCLRSNFLMIFWGVCAVYTRSRFCMNTR